MTETGNRYIKALRAQFINELKDPVTAHLVVGMMITEDTAHPLPVLESLLNRTCYVRSHGLKKSLVDMITGGFYGPYNRHKYPSALASIGSSRVLRARLNDAIDQAFAGSNVIQGYTDQGLPTDPNGWRKPRMWIGGEIFNDWGGGPGGHAGAEAWRQDFLARAATEPLKASIMDIDSDVAD